MDNNNVLFDLAKNVDWRGILRECAGREPGVFRKIDLSFDDDYMSSMWSAVLDDFEEHSLNIPTRFKDAMEHGLSFIFDCFQENCTEDEITPASKLLLMLFQDEIDELSVLHGMEMEAVRLPDVAELIADLRLLDEAVPELNAMDELPLGWTEGLDKLEDEEG